MNYSMRVWFEIDRLTSLNLTPQRPRRRRSRARTSRPRWAASAPSRSRDTQQFQINIQTLGRLVTPEQFGDIVIRANPDGSVLRVRDVARVELGAAGHGHRRAG